MEEDRISVEIIDNKNEEEMITISQAAQLAKRDKQTIRRNIEKNMYPGAYKIKESSGVEVWMIPKKYFDEAYTIKEVAQLTRQISVPELMKAFSMMIQMEVTPLKEEIKNLSNIITELNLSNDDLEGLKKEIYDINNKLDIETLREAFKKRTSFWDKFKKKPGKD